MNGKKSNGIGTIRKRREGLWEARYTAGTDLLTGKQIQKSVYGKTKPEAKRSWQLQLQTYRSRKKSYLRHHLALEAGWTSGLRTTAVPENPIRLSSMSIR